MRASGCQMKFFIGLQRNCDFWLLEKNDSVLKPLKHIIILAANRLIKLWQKLWYLTFNLHSVGYNFIWSFLEWCFLKMKKLNIKAAPLIINRRYYVIYKLGYSMLYNTYNFSVWVLCCNFLFKIVSISWLNFVFIIWAVDWVHVTLQFRAAKNTFLSGNLGYGEKLS